MGVSASALDAGAFSRVEEPRDDDCQHREGDEDVEGWSDVLEVGVGPAENLRDQERAVGGNRCREARDERSVERVVEDVSSLQPLPSWLKQSSYLMSVVVRSIAALVSLSSLR